MTKFIPYEKLSKKQKRKIDQKRRGSWGNLNPVTRRSKSKKIYNRAKSKRSASNGADLFCVNTKLSYYSAVTVPATLRMLLTLFSF